MNQKIKLSGDIIGLDLGMSRTGVARINTLARIYEALPEIKMSDKFLDDISRVVMQQDAEALVVGMPRGLDGQDTQQSKWCQQMLVTIRDRFSDLPVFDIDEAGTTKRAEEIAQPGESVDSVAAGVIAEDFVNEVILGNIDNVSI